MINLVIPAAGISSRLRPLSSNMSKIMVRINGKPCLDYIIEQAKILANIQNDELGEIIIVDGEFCDIREYCKQKYNNIYVDLLMRVNLVYQLLKMKIIRL